MNQHIEAVVAMNRKRVIGRNGQIPWKISEDLKRFKLITTTYPKSAVVMGRKTHESIGRELPGRLNLVLSRSSPPKYGGALGLSSLIDALQLCEKNDYHPFIIGGGEVYEQALPWIKILHLSLVDDDSCEPGDVLFPKFEYLGWNAFTSQHFPAGDTATFAHTYIALEQNPAGEFKIPV